MAVAVALGLVASGGGVWLSAALNTGTGATVVLLAIAGFFLVSVGAGIWRRQRRGRSATGRRGAGRGGPDGAGRDGAGRDGAGAGPLAAGRRDAPSGQPASSAPPVSATESEVVLDRSL
jgi:hypothetical protein